MKEHQRVVFLLLTGLLLLLGASGAGAAIESNNVLQLIQDEYQRKAASWSATLNEFAVRLFWILALIEFGYTGISTALQRVEWAEVIAAVTHRVLFIGFFLTLLTFGQAWAKSIVDSLYQAAEAANRAAGGYPNISPALIFDDGLELAGTVLDALSLTSPLDSIGLFIAALIIMVCFALMAAFLLLAIIEGYIVLYAGVLFLGFGGSRWTKDYTIALFRYALSVGAKLFVILLLVGLGQAFIQDWVSAFEADNAQTTVLIGAAIVMLVLVKCIPDIVAGLIQGVSPGTGQPFLQTAATVGGAAAAAGMASAGGGMAVREAAKLASAQGAGSAGGVAGAAGLAGATALNLGRAAVADLGGRLSGQWSAQYGTLGGRMAATMKEQRLAGSALTKQGDPPPVQGESSGGTIAGGSRATEYPSPAVQKD